MEIKWALPSNLLSASVEIMRPSGAMGNEGLALWFGAVSSASVDVSHVVAVHGSGFRSAPLQLRLSYRAMEVLTDLSVSLGTYLIGQIHSHPGLMLDLSDVDKTYGIRCQDYLSIVCPHYAQRDLHTVHECGVHVFDKGGYRRLSRVEIERRILKSVGLANKIAIEVPE